MGVLIPLEDPSPCREVCSLLFGAARPGGDAVVTATDACGNAAPSLVRDIATGNVDTGNPIFGLVIRIMDALELSERARQGLIGFARSGPQIVASEVTDDSNSSVMGENPGRANWVTTSPSRAGCPGRGRLNNGEVSTCPSYSVVGKAPMGVHSPFELETEVRESLRWEKTGEVHGLRTLSRATLTLLRRVLG